MISWEKSHYPINDSIEELEFDRDEQEVMVTMRFQEESENIYDDISVYIPIEEFRILLMKLQDEYGEA